MRIFCTAKDSHIFSTKNNSGIDNVVSIYLMNWRLNDVVRLSLGYRCFEQPAPKSKDGVSSMKGAEYSFFVLPTLCSVNPVIQSVQ